MMIKRYDILQLWNQIKEKKVIETQYYYILLIIIFLLLDKKGKI
jgi:hypothetical protein